MSGLMDMRLRDCGRILKHDVDVKCLSISILTKRLPSIAQNQNRKTCLFFCTPKVEEK